MAFKFICVFALLAVCNAGVAPVLLKSHEILEEHAPAQYEFGYSVHDSHTGDIKSQHEVRSGDNVQGQYSLVEPDGSRRVVDYSSDAHNGFNAHVRREGHAHIVPDHHAAPIAVAHHAAPIAVAHHAAPIAVAHHAAPIAVAHQASPITVAHHAAPITVAHHAAPIAVAHHSAPTFTVAHAAPAALAHQTATYTQHGAPVALTHAAPISHAAFAAPNAHFATPFIASHHGLH